MSGADPRPMTPSDLRMIRYFFVEKGDLSRWVSWEDKREAFMAQFPAIHMKMELATATPAMAEQLVDDIGSLLVRAEQQASI